LIDQPIRSQRRKAVKLASLLVDEIKSWIVLRNLRPGAGLPSEAQLMEEFSCSRGTIREALRILESEGLIETKPGPKGGISVTAPGHDSISRSFALMLHFHEGEKDPGTDKAEALLEARTELEAVCAGLAARHATSEDLAAMEKIIEDIEDDAPDQYGRSVDANHIFHLAVARATHSPILWPAMRALSDLHYRMMAPPIRVDREVVVAAWKAHRRILAAIQDRDSELATRRMRRHLSEFHNIVAATNQLRLLADAVPDVFRASGEYLVESRQLPPPER
jgi:GntR family transcriptional regulator, transcriptional repressor for pyruvate dehydrogenase complex